MSWTKEECKALGDLLPHELDDLLTEEEAEAVHEYLRIMAENRRRAEVESRGLAMP